MASLATFVYIYHNIIGGMVQSSVTYGGGGGGGGGHSAKIL